MNFIVARSGYIFRPEIPVEKMTEAEKAYLASGRWKIVSIDDTNQTMIAHALQSHCKGVDGKIVLKDETEWPEYAGASE